MGTTAADPRERRRALQTGGNNLKPKSAPSKTDRSALPGFGSSGIAAKKQQAKTNKLNTPTKKNTTPPPAAAPAATAAARDVLRNHDANAVAVPAAAAQLAGDPYEFAADDWEEEGAHNRKQQAGAASTAVKQQQQQPRPAAAGTKPKPGRLTALGFHLRGGINSSSASRQLFSGVNGVAHAPYTAGSSAAAAGFASANAVVGTAGGQAGRLKKQVDIRGFTEPLPLLSSPTRYNGKLPAGMLNHGNTCYLNAVLQALLSLPCLGRDLTGDRLTQLLLPQQGVTLALQTCLKQHTASCGAISPAAVSAAMAQLSARWGGCRQEDAHEFLTALLEAVQTEVLAAQVKQLKSTAAASTSSDSGAPAAAAAAAGAVEAADSAMPDAHAEAEAEPQQHDEEAAAAAAEAPGLAAAEPQQADAAAERTCAAAAAGGPRLRVSTVLCPASRNFTGCLQHTLTCIECGHVTLVKEQFNHLSLDLPTPAGSSAGAAGAGSGSAPGSPARGHGQQQQGADAELKWLLSGGVSQPTAGAAGGGNSSSDLQHVPDLQALLANFFAPETLEKACEACGAAAAQHSLTHAVRRLPRVLVVHLKRFQWQVLPGGGAICRKLSTRVRPDTQLHLGAVCCPGRPVPPLLAELMPAGLLQAADAACTAEPCVGSGLAGSKRSRTDVDEPHAAADDVVDAVDDVENQWTAGSTKQQQQRHQEALQPLKLAKQQELPQAWAAAAAAAAGGGAGYLGKQQQGQQSRLGRMSQADQQQQQGPGNSTKPSAPGFSSFGGLFTSSLPGGGRFTDLTQVQQQHDQQRPLKRSRSPPGADIRASGELVIEPADADVADAYRLSGEGCGLARNNSSTHVVDLASLEEDDDDDLQRAINASLLTAAQEGHPTHPSSSQQPTQPQQQDLAMPQWMSGGSTLAAGAAAECSTPPSTPKSQGFAPLPALLQPHRQDLDDQLHSWVPVGDATDQQQQPAGSGGLSGGAAGLFDGLAFSDERPAAPRQQGDRCMPAGTPFAGLQRVGRLGDISGTFAPGSPARVEQPQPARGRNVSNSSGAGGPFAGQLHRAAAGGGAGAAGSGLSGLLDGLDSMTEEQQLKRAMELSLMDSAAGNAAAGADEDADAAGLAGLLVDKDGYDEDAALQKALEESAAAAEMQLLQQQVKDAEEAAAAAAGKQQGSGEAAEAAQQQGQGAGTGPDAAAGGRDGGSGDDDDDAVVVAESGAGGDGGQQQQQRQRLSLVRLVEDSDCEDEGSKAAPTAGTAAVQAASAAAADAGAGSESMQVDVPEQLPAVAAAAAASPQQQLGKENQEQQEQHGAAGAAAACSKPKRRPLGEVLCSRDAARANSSLGSALAAADAAAPPVKQPNLAAAVAASEAAAASSGAGGQAGELEAVHAAAAAQAAGAWPQQSAALYQLRAVVRHKGPLASSGHFVSEVLSDQQGGQWFHYDDSFVQPTKLETVVKRCQADGYLFFYANSAILGGHTQQETQQ